MSLSMFVCVKQVPDTKNISGDAMTPEGTVNRSALPAVFNPEDLNALELALELRGRFGGTVTVCTMGPPAAANVLRHALYMGADETILLTDRKFAGSDTLATSYVLSKAVAKFGACDLVLCGRQAIDGDTAQVGPQLAEKLGIPQVTYVESVLDVADGKVRVRNVLDDGYQVVSCPMPLLMTVTATANVPRPCGARRLMQFKKAATRSELVKKLGGGDYEDANRLAAEEERLKAAGLWIHEWTAEDLEIDSAQSGIPGSPTKVKGIESVVLTARETKVVDPGQEGINDLVHELISQHILS